MDDVCQFCGTGHHAHKRLACGDRVACLEAGAAPLRSALVRAARLLHQYDRHVADFPICRQYPCVENQAALSSKAGKGWLSPEQADSLVMALRPFVAFAMHIVPNSPDDAELLPDLAVAHFRNARAALDALRVE